MSGPGSPTAGGSPLAPRRRKPAVPLQLFPTSYVDLDLDGGPGAANESNPQLPLPPLAPATPPGSAVAPPSPHSLPQSVNFQSTQNPAGAPHTLLHPQQLLPPHPQQPMTYGGGTSPVATPPSSSYSPATTGGGFVPDSYSATALDASAQYLHQHPQPPHPHPAPSYFLPPHPQQHQPQAAEHVHPPQAPQFYAVPSGGAGATSGGAASASEPGGSSSVPDAFVASTPASQLGLGADGYQPIFEDDVPSHHGGQQLKKRGKGRAEDEDDYMGLFNKPKSASPMPPPTKQAGDNSALTSLFATSASSLRQRRGGSSGEEPSSTSEQSQRPAPATSTASAAGGRRQSAASKPGSWHWPWASRLVGVLLLTYFASLAYRYYEKDGPEALVDTLLNLQVFVLFAGLGMLVLSPTLIGTSLVMLSYYHFSWWADVVHWLVTGTFYFGTAVPIASFSWDFSDYFGIADLTYHALFLPLCFLALYKNGGVRWRAGFLSFFLHSLLFLLSTTHPLPVPLFQGPAPFAYRSANLYEQAYKSENSPPYRTFMAHAPLHLRQAAEDYAVPFLEQQGLHVNLERAAPELGGGIVVPPYVYSILWIALCNLVAFVLLKVLSFVLLQRGAQQGKKKKAE